MACVTVTIAEAVAVTIAEKVVKHNEKKALATGGAAKIKNSSFPFSKKLSILKKMLWGGSALLLFEHIWHGEITPFFPFFTAANSAEELTQMFHEMATTGVLMSVAVTALWGGLMLAVKATEKTGKKAEEEA